MVIGTTVFSSCCFLKLKWALEYVIKLRHSNTNSVTHISEIQEQFMAATFYFHFLKLMNVSLWEIC